MKIVACLMVVSLAWMVGCKSTECGEKPASVEMPPAQVAEAAPEAGIEMQAIESSTIDKIGYDADSEVLKITFDGGESYKYLQVPEKKYKGLMKSKSKGKYFHNNIKDKFAAEKAD